MESSGPQREAGRAAAQEFARALEAQEPAPAASASTSLREWCSALARSSPALLCALAIGALVLLLLTRPPFVVCFEYDQRRPWKGTQRVSWISVVVVATVVTAAPLVASCLL
jgi:hypothetical protein